MFKELDAESKSTNSFAGPLLERIKREKAMSNEEKLKVVFLPVAKPEQAGRNTEKAEVVFLPVANQTKPAAVKGIMQTPKKETLPYWPSGPIKTATLPYQTTGPIRATALPYQTTEPIRATTMPYQTSERVKLLPLAATQETEQVHRGAGGFGSQGRGSGFGGSFGDGRAIGGGAAQVEREKAQTLPMRSGTDAGGGTIKNSDPSKNWGFGTSTPEIYAGDIEGIVYGIKIYQKILTNGMSELETLKAQFDANPTQQTRDNYNVRWEAYNRDLGVYKQYMGLYQTYYDPEDIKRREKGVTEEISELKEKKWEDMTDTFLSSSPIRNLVGATWSADRVRANYDGQITDKKQEKKDLDELYYVAENVQKLKTLQTDTSALKSYDRGKALQAEIDRVLRVAGDALDHNGGQEVVADKKYLLKKYGITQSAIDQYAISGGNYLPSEDGRYTNILQLFDDLKRELNVEKDKLSAKEYDYDRMVEYEQKVKEQEAAARGLEEAIQFAKDHPVLASIDTVLASPFVGIDYLKTVIPAMINGDPDNLESYVPPKLYNMELSNYTNAVRGTVAEGIKDLVAWEPAGEFLSTLYSKGMGVADLATQAAAFGPTGALFLGSTRVATDTARSMLERGSSGTEAFWGSMAVGTVNMLIYEYGVGELMKLSGPADTSTLTGMLDGALKRAGVTATAGATNEMSKILIDTAIMGHSSEFDLDMKRLRSEGMSAEEAWKHTFTDYVERVVDTGMRSGRYGLIAGLSEYGGEYFRQHPEAFNALVNGKTGWSGNMQSLRSGEGGLLGLPQGFNSGSNTSGMPILPGPAVVKDDWETALEEAVTEWKESGAERPEEPETIDISGESGITIGRGIGGTNGWIELPGQAEEWSQVWDAGEPGKYIDNTTDTLTQGEKLVINDLVKQGKTIERIPRDPKSIDSTPDFYVDNVKTELKTLENPNTNTGMKRIQKGFSQGAESVIIDARKSGLTRAQADEIIVRAKGKYPNGQLPGVVEIWISGEIITYP